MSSPTPAWEPGKMPHLRGETPDFIALADADAVVDNVHIPLHSHVLARSSRVFGQLFTSLAESQDRATPKPKGSVDLSDLFSGESLATVLVTMYLVYNTARENVQALFETLHWSSHDACEVDITLDASLMQSVVGLADKLDARGLLDEVESACGRGYMLQRDLLGWLATGMRLHMHWLRDRALTEIVNTLQSVQQQPALNLLRDRRWRELDSGLLLLLIDGLTAHKYRPTARAPISVDAWKEMGDLTASFLGNNPAGVQAPGPPPLDELEQAQMLQAAANWHNEFAELSADEDEEVDDGTDDDADNDGEGW